MARPLSTTWNEERMLIDLGIVRESGIVLYAVEQPKQGDMSAKTYAAVLAAMEDDFRKASLRARVTYFPVRGGYRVAESKHHKEAGSTWYLVMAGDRHLFRGIPNS